MAPPNRYFAKSKIDFGDSDKNRKFNFLDYNREELNKILQGIAHKRGFLNILLNEGYATNMLNMDYTINPDSMVLARNPSIAVDKRDYTHLGNFGLDSLERIADRLSEDIKKRLTRRGIFDNNKGIPKLLGADKLTLAESAEIIDMILNDGKKLLKDKYGDDMWRFFKEHPEAEDEMLYAYYRMPGDDSKKGNGFKNRLNRSSTIEEMYQTYLEGSLNHSFEKVDNYRKVIDSYFKYRLGGKLPIPIKTW